MIDLCTLGTGGTMPLPDRALASLYVRVGGRMLCWKGPAVREEMAAGERACKMLGGQAEGLYRLPIEGREHYVHSAIKISATARRYPRKSGTPSKDPLGILPQKP